jgi:prophage regulatory protein
MTSRNANRDATLLRRRDVTARTGLALSTIYALMKKGVFPAQIKIGPGSSVAWIKSEVDDWIENQIDKSRAGA